MAVIAAFLQLLLASSAVNAFPLLSFLHRRAVLPNPNIISLPESVPAGVVGDVYEAYQPYLEVYNGCVPSPAVDANGNTNAGLDLKGKPNQGCGSNLGQVYARAAAVDGRYAILYSWYWPKDSPSPGLGHRHDWEGVVVWLKDGTSTSPDNILAICPSAHGDWKCSKTFFLSGSGPFVAYFSIWPVNHQLGIGVEKGGQQPLVAWESLPEAARNALQNTDFGSATVPFKDSTFAANLAKAKL
ncbi:putative necrosis and ethylene inducing peptide 2 [Bisporella sp. PMI_857]|nr:putative necrosis and ethylene inducing peptide 2 [Bisporella sp. PMI_857]